MAKKARVYPKGVFRLTWGGEDKYFRLARLLFVINVFEVQAKLRKLNLKVPEEEWLKALRFRFFRIKSVALAEFDERDVGYLINESGVLCNFGPRAKLGNNDWLWLVEVEEPLWPLPLHNLFSFLRHHVSWRWRAWIRKETLIDGKIPKWGVLSLD